MGFYTGNILTFSCFPFSQTAGLPVEEGVPIGEALASGLDLLFSIQPPSLLENSDARFSLLARSGGLLQPVDRMMGAVREVLSVAAAGSEKGDTGGIGGGGGGLGGGGPKNPKKSNMPIIWKAVVRKDIRFLLNILYAGSEYAKYLERDPQIGIVYTVEEARVAMHALMEWEECRGELASVTRYWGWYVYTEISNALMNELLLSFRTPASLPAVEAENSWIVRNIRTLASRGEEEDWRSIMAIAETSTSRDVVRETVEAIFVIGKSVPQYFLFLAAREKYGNSVLWEFKEEIIQRINTLQIKKIQETTRDNVKELLSFIQKESTPFNGSKQPFPYSFDTVKAAVDRVLELCGSDALFVFEEEFKYTAIERNSDLLTYIRSKSEALLLEGAVAPECVAVSNEGIEERAVPFQTTHPSGKVNLRIGDTIALRPGEDYLLTRKLGQGVIVDVYLGEMKNPRKLLAIKNIRVEKNASFLVSEVKRLHMLAAALEEEPKENFPEGIRRSYFPIPYSGVRAAQFGVLAVELCLGPTEGEYAATLKPHERIPVALQILHALAIAEGVGVLNTDVKSTPVQAHVVGGTAKFLDWNVTQPRVPSRHINRKRVREIIHQWLFASARMLQGTSDGIFQFHKNSSEDADYSLVQEIRPDKNWSAVLKTMVLEAVVEERFTTVREAYQRFLQLSKGPHEVNEEEFDVAIARFNASCEERKKGRLEEADAERLEWVREHGDYLLTPEEIRQAKISVHSDLVDYAGRDSEFRELLRLYGEKVYPDDLLSVRETFLAHLKRRIEGLTLPQARTLLLRLKKATAENGDLPGIDFIGMFLELFPELK